MSLTHDCCPPGTARPTSTPDLPFLCAQSMAMSIDTLLKIPIHNDPAGSTHPRPVDGLQSTTKTTKLSSR